ncbi:Hydroxyacylglutathione hydrolase [Geodia barretti]|uniref:Hydroxyacylglutathione hydrolase n=1 Tax=Geodia barretti TaxID=519541 RepID=A0AA35RCA1_GEOBA|nr:Hydroxyacylglutathione hydrolase [Geodia barretti]
MTLHYDGEVKIAKINMGPYDNNGYIVICPDTNEGIIIDTPAEPEKLINEVGDVQIKAILITHKHQDHLLGFAEITGAIGAPVAVHANDVDGLPRAPETVLNDGDTILSATCKPRPFTPPAILREPLATCPEALQQILNSVSGKLLTLPDEVAVYAGHGAVDTTIGEARRRYQVFTSKSHSPDLCGDIDWLETE